MANTLSDLFANILSKPNVKNDSVLHGRPIWQAQAVILSANTDIAGQLYPLFRLSAFARLISLGFANTADAGWTSIEVGVWPKNDFTVSDGTAISATILVGTTLDAHLAQKGMKQVLGTGTGSYAPNLEGTPLWQQIGVSAAPAPGTEYDIVMTSVAQPSGGGTMVWRASYVAMQPS